MNFGRVAFGLLLLSAVCAAQQYVISTIAGGAPPATPSPAVSGSIGAPISIVTDAAGNAYFASPEMNVVFKLDTAGVLTRVAGNGRVGYSGDGGPAANAQLYLSFTQSASLAVDNAGNLFIADTSNFRVRRVTPNGIITTVAGNGTYGFSGDGGPATIAQLTAPWGVAVDGAGNLFILDAHAYRIRKVAADGIITTFAGGGNLAGSSGDGGPATSAVLSAWGAAADSAGNLFIVDDIPAGGPPPILARRTIRKISPTGIISTVAQVNAWSVAVDGEGNLFVATFSSRIDKVAPDGSITTVAGNGAIGFSGDDGPATSAQLNYPSAVAVDKAGNLFIADRLNKRIRRVSSGGIVTVAGDGPSGNPWDSPIPANDGGPATNVQLRGPSSVAADSEGNLFIAEYTRIRKVSPSGIISTVAGNSTAGFSGDGGPATDAQLKGPVALAVDGDHNLFILDADNFRVRKVSANGTISTVAGNGMNGHSGDGGPAVKAALNGFNCNAACGGLAVDRLGNLFIAESDNGRVRKVSASGIITTVAGTGGYEISGDGGPATDAGLNAPVGLAVDGAGNLLIAGTGRIRRIDSGGVITTIAGGGQLSGSAADGGPATDAQLGFPYAMTVDSGGNLLIADPGWNFFTGDAGDGPADHRIRKVSPSGIITTVAGIGAAGYSGDGGPASTATLNAPQGVAVDSSGNVYVADTGNRVVRILRPVTRSVLIGTVVDAASQRLDVVAPGKIVVIYGAGLGAELPTERQPGDTVVSFNGIAAPILYSSATQVTATVPINLTGVSAQVTVTYQGQSSAPYTIPVAASAPSLFTANQAGWGQAAAINAVDGTLNSATNPVNIGAHISLFATGAGQTENALPVKVMVGGIPAAVQYAGSAPGQVAGLMQVNVQIPAGVKPGGYVPVVLDVGNASTTPSAVWIAVSEK